MKLQNLLTTTRSKKVAACAVIFLTTLVFLNIDSTLDETQRLLKKDGGKISNVLSRTDISEEDSFLARYLSINLGGGNCQWTAPLEMSESDPSTTTMLASYPGSGKRLVWRLLEALTGYRTGDDWDLSLNGYTVLTLKTSYPHHEGIWSWGSMMDQMVMLIRNPRFAIPSYHTMRYELDYSKNWDESYSRINYTYTERPEVEEWIPWRDRKFDDELDYWANFTDFWMTGGQKWVVDGTEYDYHCIDHATNDGFMVPKMLDCKPKTIIQFEKLYSPDEDTGTAELLKLASVLDGVEHTNIIDLEARPCVYKEVMRRHQFYNRNRDGKGPDPELKKFTPAQLTKMKRKMQELKEKFSTGIWLEDKDAVTLVMILNSYINEVQAELTVMLDYYDATEQPTPSPAYSEPCTDTPGWYFNRDPAFTCRLIDVNMCNTISDIYKGDQGGVTANDACCICGGGVRGETDVSSS